MTKNDAMATFQAFVASVRAGDCCVLEARSDEGEDIFVCCHLHSDHDNGTISVIPLARLLSEPEVAGLSVAGSVAHRPSDVIHMQITSENKDRN
jgi:hypothetical protein